MLPPNLQPLIDADILRYELGYASEVGWRAKTQKDESPPFSYVADLLHQRLADIGSACNTLKKPRLFFTTGKTFRFNLAKKRPYKGTRVEKRPFHFDNLTVYLRDIMGAEEVTGIEADDSLAINHCSGLGDTILCSRDKDLKQLPGWFYSWELARQPSFGPSQITKEGNLKLTPAEGKRPAKLTGTGLSWFYAQVLMGDPTDNIPGLPGTGAVAAYNTLTKLISGLPEAVENRELLTPPEMLDAVQDAYKDFYNYPTWNTELEEQGRLCWLTRRLNEDGSPQLWEIGMEE